MTRVGHGDDAGRPAVDGHEDRRLAGRHRAPSLGRRSAAASPPRRPSAACRTSPARRSLPTATSRPPTTARTPWPATAVNRSGLGHAQAALLGGGARWRRRADARSRARRPPPAAAAVLGERAGEPSRLPGAPARRSRRARRRRSRCGRPSVIVPVLSSTTVCQLVRRLQRRAVADEHAVLGALAGAHHDRRGRRQAQGAGAGDHQHGDEVEQGVVERRRGAERRARRPR